jgi:hypothetical protein
MNLQQEAILEKHFTEFFEANLNEEVYYIEQHIFDVINELGGLNNLVEKLINDTEWDYYTDRHLRMKYL